MNSYLSKVKLFIQRHPLAMIVLLAIILRVCKLRYAYYGTINELARDLNVVYDILVYHKIPLLGPSASLGGFYFGAFYYYLMVPFVWISNFFAWGAVALSGIFSVLQVIAMYHLLKLWFNNEKMGLLGALITAVCLFDVQNSYYISNPNLLPFFVIVFLYGVTRVLQHTDNWKTNVSTGLAFGMATQLHATALLILPILVLICIVIYRQKINYLRLWPGIVAFAVTFIPYFVYEATHRFVNTTGIIKLGGNHLGLPIKLTSIEALIVFWNSIFFFKSDYFNLFLTNNIAYLILLSALVLFGLALLISYRKKESILVPIISREGKILLASWFIVTTIVMLLYQAVLPEYYFLIFWPLPVIVFVWFTYFVITNFRKLGQVFITLYLIMQMVQLYYFYQIVEFKELDYNNYKAMFDYAVAESGEQGFKIISDNDYTYFLTYYARLYDLDKYQQKSNSNLLYIIVETKYGQSVEPDPSRFEKLEDANFGNFKVIKYLRKT